MAKSTISFALIFSSLLIMALIAESRPTPTVAAGPICSGVHAVEVRETCTSIEQRFSLDESHFLALNPNINCNLIFVGQWVCVEGKAI